MKPLVCWDSGCWLAGPENDGGDQEGPCITEVNLLEIISWDSAHRSCVPQRSLRWQVTLASVVVAKESYSGVLVLKEWKGHGEYLRLGIVLEQERPMVKVQSQVSVEGEELKGSFKDIEVWCQEESLWQALGKREAQDTSDLQRLVSWDDCQKQHQWSRASWRLEYKMCCCWEQSKKSDSSSLKQPRRQWTNPR